MTDEELMSRAASGEGPALDTLVRRHRGSAVRWALFELGDPGLAEDACQDAWVRVLRAASSFDPARPFGPWLRALVRVACADVRRGEVRAARRTEPPRPDAVVAERDLDLARGAALAQDAFADLSPRQREAYWLCDREGLSAVEAGERMGVEAGTVRALVHQARRAVRTSILRRSPDLADVVRGP